MSLDKTIGTIHKLGLTTKTLVNLMYTTRAVEDSINKVLQLQDLTIPQYNVLRILRAQRGKPANLFTIQERMIAKSSNATRLVDKLIHKGYVRREVCKANRRKVEITITENGMRLLEQLDPLVKENNNRIVSKLTNDQMEQLNSILDMLRE